MILRRGCWLVAVLLVACGSPALRRADIPERCSQPDVRQVLRDARQSLPLTPYHPGRPYDVDAHNQPVPLQLGPVPADALAVLSYPDPTRFDGGDRDFGQMARRSFTYDMALTALWLVHDGDVARARRLLATLAALQRPDGAWGFSFATASDDGFYNAGYVRTGTVAWVVYALAHYRTVSRDPQFDRTAERALTWLLRQRGDDGLFRGGSGRWLDAAHFDPDWRADVAATEHQVDVWFALRAASQAWPGLAQSLSLPQVAREQARMTRQLLRLLEGRYAQGLGGPPRRGQDRESALDAAGTWTALWEIAQGQQDGARELLTWVTGHHGVDVHGWPGLRPYLQTGPVTWFVEASIARPLAYQRLGDRSRATHAWRPLLQLACAGGLPVVYAPDWHPDFPFSPATAPTVWLLIAGQEIVEGGAPWFWTEGP